MMDHRLRPEANEPTTPSVEPDVVDVPAIEADVVDTPASEAPVSVAGTPAVSAPSEPEQLRRLAFLLDAEAEEPRKETRRERRQRERAEREAAKLAAKAAKDEEKAAREAAKVAAKAEQEAAKLLPKNERKAAKQAAELAAKAEQEAAKAAAAAEKEAAKLAAQAEKEAAKLAAQAEKEAAKVAKAEAKAAKKSVRRSKSATAEPARDRREKRLVGLKIGASQIAAARINNNGSPVLVEAVREPLEPGVVVSGEIRDPAALASALERFFERHKLPKKGVRLGVSNNRIGVRVFEIEGVEDDRQLENAIRFRAEEVLPIPLDEAVLDYVILDDSTREDGVAVRRILLVVAYREVVDRYLEACREAGLEVVGIDLEAFALLRALQAPTDEPPGAGALVAVAVGHDRTTIAVSTGRYCEFTRVLDWGGWTLNVAVARELDMAPSEVERIKRQLSFAEDTAVEGLTPEQTSKARDAIQRALAAFARELVASLHFYQAQPEALGIGEIVLTGGTAHMAGLSEAVGRLIGAPVRIGDPFKRVKVARKVEDVANPGSLAVAIGLGIED
jgi:type IV pilus assembly protein PilM